MGARGRTGRSTVAALLASAALIAGCGGGSGGEFGATATTPPTATVPGAPPADRYAPPPIRVTYGRGPQIGARVRTRHAETTFGTLPSGFSPGGVPVGSSAGLCRVPAIDAEDRSALEAATRRQTPDAEVLPLRDEEILLADCGSSGRWALVAWIAESGGEASVWIDELRDDGDGRWTGTARDVYPGCRMPLAAAAVWQVDVTRCPASARRPPSLAPPRRAAPRPLGRLADGSSRA